MRTQHLQKLAWLLMLVFFLTSCNKNKIKCTGDSEKDYIVTNFKKVSAQDNFNLVVTKGNTYTMKAKGCTENINDLKVTVDGDVLNIRYKSSKWHKENLDIIITMPELLKLDVSGATKATINGMAAQPLPLQTILSGASECIINGAATDMLFNISGASKLEITGASNVLTGELSGASHLKCYGLSSKQVDIDASGASDAYVYVQDKLYAEASGASKIYYKGNPPAVHANTSGNSKIIKE